MKYSLLILMLITTPVLANPPPDAGETANSNVEFNSRDTAQSSYHTTNGVYEQKLAEVINGTTYETYVYEGPSGVGYIHRAIRESNGIMYFREKHIGSETDRVIKTAWVEKIQDPKNYADGEA